MYPRQAEVEKKWAEVNVADAETIRTHRAVRASCTAQGFKATEDMVMVCRFCGTELYHIKAGESATHDILGTCDCSWHCCNRVIERHHERHLVWIPERRE